MLNTEKLFLAAPDALNYHGKQCVPMEARMVFSVQQIKYEFLYYIKGLGGSFDDWYVGVATDPETALFETHRVDREADPWIYKPALTGKATFTVLRYFRDVLHTDADPTLDFEEGATYAFAFRKSASTSPSRP